MGTPHEATPKTARVSNPVNRAADGSAVSSCARCDRYITRMRKGPWWHTGSGKRECGEDAKR